MEEGTLGNSLSLNALNIEALQQQSFDIVGGNKYRFITKGNARHVIFYETSLITLMSI